MNKISVFGERISTEEELRSFIGYPGDLVNRKVIFHLDVHCRNFIAQSPFLLLATADHSGLCDVSPRGDVPGFVFVLDEKHLVIPERPGNRRVDSMRNILSNPQVGLLFLIPGLGETLRINGKACLVKDEKLLKQMEVNGRSPLVGIGVEVEECFVHCAKAILRSKLWEPETWPDKKRLPSAAKMLADHAKMPGTTVDEIAEILRESYSNRL
ncbi:pyridoxamine 5'-phosphate oxidase family protein [Aneurinibacillus thermoaerophilus]|uniref:pyridoxamine 5'-phosphate oxidase family protein n=1 Tax=Aneurinibacillus thermoaerophilus TaxID=143495 RepID=UPI002E1B689C|nr:pyridoxamine 5'-phosphate oxidase family protein [Aneurinibacillus thermoaerophilus]MED0765697.1 pyridoxamine 5'-phosphate oxidase family protein [Aneurinibacillus thermoaerophilus]